MLIPLKEIFIEKSNYIDGPGQVFLWIMGALNYLKKSDPEVLEVEHAFAIGLNGKKRILYIDEVSRGLDDQTMMRGKEIFRQAVINRASMVIIAHNHPSGIISPSEDDISITQKLKKAGEFLGIKLLDHLIVIDPANPDIVREGESPIPYYVFSQHNLI